MIYHLLLLPRFGNVAPLVAKPRGSHPAAAAMASQDSSRKRHGIFLEQVRTKMTAMDEPEHNKGKMLLETLRQDDAALAKLLGSKSEGMPDALKEILPASEWKLVIALWKP